MLTLKQQLEQGLSAFGVKLPAQFPIEREIGPMFS